MRRGGRIATGAAVVLATLALAGCGEVSPGAAATVEGEAIPLSQVDAMARAFCAAELASAEQQVAGSTQEYRNTVLSTLVNERLAIVVTEQLGIEVPPAAYAQDYNQFQPLFDQLSAEEGEALRDYIAVFGRLQAATEAIGRETGPAAASTNPAAAGAAGQEYLAEQADEADIELDPRFGELSSGQVVGGSGSLSVPVEVESATGAGGGGGDDRPASQTCA